MLFRSRLSYCWWSVLLGCGSSPPAAQAPPPPSVEKRSTIISHEPCGESGKVEQLDAHGDGKSEIKREIDASGRERCRAIDLNRDGKPDLYEYFESDGTLRRREVSYDRSGAIGAIESYEGGKLIRRELDTTGQRKIDTWDTFDPATGLRIKRERDLDGNGTIDQWWTWNQGVLTISTDKSGSGQPDPEATIVIHERDAGRSESADAAPVDATPEATIADAGAQG